MGGMTSGLKTNDPVLVGAFQSALLHQAWIVLAVILVLTLTHGFLRWRGAAMTPPPAEPRARAVLRVSFGVLWLVDSILQAQPKMAGGLPSEVMQPGAAASPRRVQDVVNAGGTIWAFHPVQAAAAAVWIQAGLGLWLLVARSGPWSRLGGLASVAWGLAVWVFGEAFGAIFAPGLSWLNGAPGAVFLYIVAGSLIALPARAWSGNRLGRLLLAGTGIFWIGMAVLQAWPGRGSWQGNGGTLTDMAGGMAGLPQPRAQAAVVNAFVRFTSAYGFAVNLVAVAALAAIGAAFCWGSPRVLRIAVPAATAFCLADWILVQDLGMPGGLGTDPNSMIPWVVLGVTGHRAAANQEHYLAERPAPSGPRLSTSWLGPRSLLPAGARGGPRGGGPDERGVAEQACGPRHRPRAVRRRRAGEPARRGLPPGQPGGPAGEPGRTARQGDTADVPGPAVHSELPGHRRDAGRAHDARPLRRPRGTSRHRREPGPLRPTGPA